MTVRVSRAVRATVRAVTTCAAVAAMATACSSSTSGSGSSGNGGGGGPTSGATAPATGSGGGGSTGNFCSDWRHIGDLSKIISAGGIQQQVVARFDQLAAEAPPEIKSAVEDFDQYVHSAINGHIDPNAAQNLAQDFQKIGTWIATNCH